MPDVDPNANAQAEPGQGAAPVVEPPQPPPTPPVAPEGIDENERKTWEGRQRKKDEEIAALTEQNELLTRWYMEHQAGTQQQPAAAPEPDFDPYDRAAFDRAVAVQVEKANKELVGQLMPILDTTLNETASLQVKEWGEIKDGVLQSAKDLGITSLTQLKSNPLLFEKLVNSERYEQSLKNPRPTPAPQAAAPEDRDALIAAGLGAGSGSAPGGDFSEYEFAPDELQYMADHKLTPEQYVQQVGGPSRIKIGGKK